MRDDFVSWLVIAFAVPGVAAAIAAFLGTPPHLRYRIVQRKPLTEQLKDLPESAHALIIKGDKGRALARFAPYILIGALLVVFSLWIEHADSPECVRLLGINAMYLSLVLFCYGMPLGCFVASVLFLKTGIKTIKTGYFPPLDAVVFSDTIARKGPVSLLQGACLLVLPAFTLFMVYLGNNVYTAAADGRNMQEISAKLEAKCPDWKRGRDNG